MKHKGEILKQTLEKDIRRMPEPSEPNEQMEIKEKPPRAGRRPIIPMQMPIKEKPPKIDPGGKKTGDTN